MCPRGPLQQPLHGHVVELLQAGTRPLIAFGAAVPQAGLHCNAMAATISSTASGRALHGRRGTALCGDAAADMRQRIWQTQIT